MYYKWLNGQDPHDEASTATSIPQQPNTALQERKEEEEDQNSEEEEEEIEAEEKEVLEKLKKEEPVFENAMAAAFANAQKD